jgi:hypothetical protein
MAKMKLNCSCDFIESYGNDYLQKVAQQLGVDDESTIGFLDIASWAPFFHLRYVSIWSGAVSCHLLTDCNVMGAVGSNF